jgi:hypothetical protein
MFAPLVVEFVENKNKLLRPQMLYLLEQGS